MVRAKARCLEMIAGVIRLTSGAVKVQGRVSAVLELDAGFNP
jgi:ABC-type polysaccharide/polyol phosphate transport system ATPase subunit